MTTAGQVWITRAEPGASATAARLAPMGWTPLVAPVLIVRPLDMPLGMDGVGALAFTSQNGVAAFAARSTRRDLPVFAVGEATAGAARAAGFGEVTSASGDVAALARRIIAAKPMGLVLHAGGASLAGDLVGDLTQAGFAVRYLALYDTLPVASLPPVAAEALRNGEVAAVLIHSPKAAEALASLLPTDQVAKVAAIGLSAACLAPLAALPFARRAPAAQPNEDALMAALGNRGGRR